MIKTGEYTKLVLFTVMTAFAYYALGWVGFAVSAVLMIGYYCVQMVDLQSKMMQTLLSRLPDRCAFCHREIVDEGGVFDELGIYHSECADKLESLEALRIEAGVSSVQAIHKPQPIAPKSGK